MDLEKVNAVYEKVSYYRKHESLTLGEWQFALRKKYAKQHPLIVERIGTQEVFSEYIVRNPDRKSSYSVSIRSNDDSALVSILRPTGWVPVNISKPYFTGYGQNLTWKRSLPRTMSLIIPQYTLITGGREESG